MIIKFVVLLKIFPHLLPAYYRRLINIISFLESAWQSLVNKENLNKSFIKNFLHEKFKIKYRVKKESCTAILNSVKQANIFWFNIAWTMKPFIRYQFSCAIKCGIPSSGKKFSYGIQGLHNGIWRFLTLDTLTSVSIFSILFSVCFFWYWQGEFIWRSKLLRLSGISFILMTLKNDSAVILL